MVQPVEVYPLDIPSISTATKSITDPKKPPMRHNRDTVCRITIFAMEWKLGLLLVIYSQLRLIGTPRFQAFCPD